MGAVGSGNNSNTSTVSVYRVCYIVLHTIFSGSFFSETMKIFLVLLLVMAISAANSANIDGRNSPANIADRMEILEAKLANWEDAAERAAKTLKAQVESI